MYFCDMVMEKSSSSIYFEVVKSYFREDVWEKLGTCEKHDVIMEYEIYKTKLDCGFEMEPPSFIKKFEEEKKNNSLVCIKPVSSTENIASNENSKSFLNSNPHHVSVEVPLKLNNIETNQNQNDGKISNKKFKISIDLKTHTLTAHKKEKGQVTKTVMNLRSRKLQECPKEDKTKKNHQRNNCNFSTLNKTYLTRHKSVHNKKVKSSSDTFSCNHCSFTARYDSTLTIHINAVHLKIKNYKCEFCEFCSARKGGLKAHVNSIHTKAENNKTFLSKES